MRTRAPFTLLSAAAIAASSALLACGSGDDNTAPSHPDGSTEASGDATSDSTQEGAAAEGGGTDAGDAGAETGAATALKHVYIIMMENHGSTQIIGDTTDAPKINALAQKYGSASQYFGVTHPSLPNYLAAISGDFQGIWDDCPAGPTVTCPPEEFIPTSGDGTMNTLMTPQQAANAAMIPHWFSGATIVDQLEAHGMTWKAYMGGLPAVGDTSAGAPTIPTADGGTETLNLYAQKHNPFMYFQGIRTNANRMQKIVPLTKFPTDIAGSTMPNYVWISPDQCADMHGINADTAAYFDAGFCTGSAAGNDMSAPVIQFGDTYVGNLTATIMASPTWSEGSAIVIVFDEDDYLGTAGCCNSPTGVDGGVLGGALVPAIVVSSLNPNATKSSDPYNHYSLLATLQHLWGFECLANTCGMSGGQLMTKLFLP
jgi:hypothetical protein